MKQAEEFILVQGLLFRISAKANSDDLKVILAVPENLAEYILSQYHDGLLACHQGVSRTFNTIRQKFFIPKLYDRLVNYIKSCEVCQQRKVPQDRDSGRIGTLVTSTSPEYLLGIAHCPRYI
jgi:hypothetical protein